MPSTENITNYQEVKKKGTTGENPADTNNWSDLGVPLMESNKATVYMNEIAKLSGSHFPNKVYKLPVFGKMILK